MVKRNSMDLTAGSVTKQIIWFSIPLMFNSLINSLYGIADKIVLGRYVGDLAMAAAGATNQPFSLIYNLFAGFSLGATVACGNLIGAHDTKGLRRCMHTAVLTSFGLGLLVCAVGLIFSRPIMTAMGTPPDILEDSLIYFRIRFLGTPLTMMGGFYNGIIMSHGDTRQITLIGTVSGLSNVILNLVFVLVFRMGVAAVAFATLCSQIIGFTWKTIMMFSSKSIYHMRLRELKMDWKICGNILRIGIPNGLNNTVFSFANALLQSTINSFGSTVVAGNSAANSVETLVSLGFAGIPNATVAAVSQCYGAHNFKRTRQIMKKSFVLCEILITILGISAIIFRWEILGLFTTTPEVINAGIPRVYAFCGGYLIHTFGQIYGAGLKGMRKSSSSLIMNLVSVCVPRILWVLFIVPLMPTPGLLYAIYPISWLTSSIALGFAYYRTLRKEEKNICSRLFDRKVCAAGRR